MTAATVPVPPPSSPDVQRLDAETLARLRAATKPGTPDVLTREITAFVTSGAKFLATLRSAAPTKNRQNLRQAGQSLKSASVKLGAGILAQCCAALEAALRDGATQAIPDAVQAIEEEFRHVERQLLRLRVPD